MASPVTTPQYSLIGCPSRVGVVENCIFVSLLQVARFVPKRIRTKPLSDRYAII
jgi:hypothetical protein